MAAPFLAPIIAGAKAHPFITSMLAWFLGETALDYMPGMPLKAMEKSQIGLAEKQLALQEAMMKAAMEGKQQAFKGQKEMTEKMMEQMLGMRKEERQEGREERAFRLFMGNKQQQTAMVLGLMQAMAEATSNMKPNYGGGPPASLVSLLR